MADEPLLTVKDAYKYAILNMWNELLVVAEDFRIEILNTQTDAQQPDKDITLVYISKLTLFWGELYPLVKGRTDLEGLESQFDRFKTYYYNPKELLKPEVFSDIFILHELIREALDKLQITR